jgi:hypothetical protein
VGTRVSALFEQEGMVPSAAGEDTVLRGTLSRDDVERVLSLLRDLGLELIDLQSDPLADGQTDEAL